MLFDFPGVKDQIWSMAEEMKWKRERCRLKDSPIGMRGAAEWKSLCLVWAHLFRVSPPPSDTLTSKEGSVYVTVTSLILCSASWELFSAMKTWDETAWKFLLGIKKKKVLVRPACTCMYTYMMTHTHIQTTHPCSPHTSPSSLLR